MKIEIDFEHEIDGVVYDVFTECEISNNSFYDEFGNVESYDVSIYHMSIYIEDIETEVESKIYNSLEKIASEKAFEEFEEMVNRV